MMWGLLVSAVTIAVSMVTKSDDKGGGDNNHKASSTALLFDGSLFSPTFISGICLGVGMNLLVTTFLQQFRVVERLRLYMVKTWENKEDAPLRTPRNMFDLMDSSTADGAGTINNGDNSTYQLVTESQYGSIHLLLSPQTAPTSTLQVALLTIRPGCELTAARATSLEFYQVVSGTASVSQQGVSETATMGPGDVWIVEPGSFRWLSNRGGGQSGGKTNDDLVLLRTVDSRVATYADAQSPVNCIHMDPGCRTKSVMNRFVASVKSLQQLASNYMNVPS